MINGYAIVLILWLFTGFILKTIRFHNTEEHPIACTIGAAIQFALMVILIINI